jgi:hypothetical protein
MVNILFNYDSDINLVQEEFEVQFSPISEMEVGCYMIAFKSEDDFDLIEAYMEENGKLEVIGVFGVSGNQYSSKKEENKYTKTKYLKWLLDKWTYDEEGNKLEKLPKTAWQVNNYLGWGTREL